MTPPIRDLRSALAFLEAHGEVASQCDLELNPELELANHYVDHFACVPATSRSGSEAMVRYTRVGGHSMPVLMGLFGSRQRNSLMLCGQRSTPHAAMMQALMRRKPPVKSVAPPCQEVVLDRNIDLTRMLPIPTLTPRDAGPYITLGVVLARDPETGARNISIHRMCVQGPDTLSIWIHPGHHLGLFHRSALEKGGRLPVSINIGLDPAVYFCACLTEPLCARGECELEIAGGIRGHGVRLSDCRTVGAECIGDAEIVLEGEITAAVGDENHATGAPSSMPEFLGYDGTPRAAIPQVRISAVTHRRDAIYHTLIGPGREQSELLAIPIEMTLLAALGKNSEAHFEDAFFSPAGGGLLMLILKVSKAGARDDAAIREAAALALSLIPPLKQVILVDADIDIHSADDVLWALSTRFQADMDLDILTGQPYFTADPSQSAAYRRDPTDSPGCAKSVMDCTVPWRLKDRFRRSFARP